jgi:hypothetical protein
MAFLVVTLESEGSYTCTYGSLGLSSLLEGLENELLTQSLTLGKKITYEDSESTRWKALGAVVRPLWFCDCKRGSTQPCLLERAAAESMSYSNPHLDHQPFVPFAPSRGTQRSLARVLAAPRNGSPWRVAQGRHSRFEVSLNRPDIMAKARRAGTVQPRISIGLNIGRRHDARGSLPSVSRAPASHARHYGGPRCSTVRALG